MTNHVRKRNLNTASITALLEGYLLTHKEKGKVHILPFLPTDMLHRGLSYPAQFPCLSWSTAFLDWEVVALAQPVEGLWELEHGW